jgi:hypothetical protein
MKVILLLLSYITIVSSIRLEFFKIAFPADQEKASLDFVENSWLQLTMGSTWEEWRFDLNFLVDSKEAYEKVVAELPSMNNYLNCNFIGNIQLRCIFWGKDIVKQLEREGNDEFTFYSLEIKNPNGEQNARIDMKIVESVQKITSLIDFVISHTDPELAATKAFLN